MRLLHDLDTICSYSLDASLESVLHFVVQFQKSQPDLVARAHLQVSSCYFMLLTFFYMFSFFPLTFCMLTHNMMTSCNVYFVV